SQILVITRTLTDISESAAPRVNRNGCYSSRTIPLGNQCMASFMISYPFALLHCRPAVKFFAQHHLLNGFANVMSSDFWAPAPKCLNGSFIEYTFQMCTGKSICLPRNLFQSNIVGKRLVLRMDFQNPQPPFLIR